MKMWNVAWRGTCCAALASGALLTTFGGQSAHAESSYDVLANAYSVQITARNQSFPLGLVMEGNGPTTQARIDSSGLSSAFASFPYPGDVVAGLPGVAGAIFGFPTPAYPFIVSTQYGDDPQDQNFPGASLHSESGAQSASSKSLAGSDTMGSTSVSRAEVLGDGSAQATGRTDMNGLIIGNQVRIQGFNSYARAFADGVSGKVTRTTSMSFDHISVPGLAITIPKSSPESIPLLNPIPGLPQPPPLTLPPVPFAMGGETIAAPNIGFIDGQFTITLPGLGEQRYAIPAEAVFEGFKRAGFTLTYQQPQALDDGVQGAGLEVSFEIPAAPENPYYGGTTPITATIGRSLAIANLRPIPVQAGGSGGFAGGDTGPPDLAGGPGVGGVDGAAVPGLTGAVGVLPGTIPGSSTEPGLASLTPATESVRLAVGQGSGQGYGDIGNIYLVLVGTGVAAFVVASGLRLLGVRFR